MEGAGQGAGGGGTPRNLAKYGVVGGGGAVAGGAFAFSLFSKFGVANLLAHPWGYSATVYAITAFSMVACVVLGTGYFAVPGDIVEARARLFNAITFGFLGVFLAGALLFIGLTIFNPPVTVQISFDDYKTQIARFHDVADPGFSLVPYIRHPGRDVFGDDQDPKSEFTLQNASSIYIGLDNLPALEQRYIDLEKTEQRQQKQLTLSNAQMMQICALAEMKSSDICKLWSGEAVGGSDDAENGG
jgi:hypothetical protein